MPRQNSTLWSAKSPYAQKRCNFAMEHHPRLANAPTKNSTCIRLLFSSIVYSKLWKGDLLQAFLDSSCARA